MDVKIVKNIINLFENSTLSELEVESNEAGNLFKVKVKKGGASETSVSETGVPAAPPRQKEKLQADTGEVEGVMDYNRVQEIKSPMVGVFYASPQPGAEPFVQKGSVVKKGDVLCIIEAMKLMNEVVAERDGEIVEVLANPGELVEFGQTLFRIF